MSYVSRIRAFLLKEGYDFEKKDINLYNFHKQFLIIIAIQGIFFGKRDSYLRFFMPFLSIGVTLIGLTLQSLNIYLGVSTLDYSKACESFCYLIMLGTVIFISMGFLFNKEKILALIEEMNADFVQVCSLGPRYRKPFLASQLLIWKLCVGWAVFIWFVATVFMIYPIIILFYQSLFATQHENMVRPMAFPVWLPHTDANATPIYEIFFILEVFYCIFFMFTFGGYVYSLFHFLLHFYVLMDMIILDFGVLFQGLDEDVANLPKHDPRRVAVQRTLNKRLGRIITWHLSIYSALKTISKVFRPSLLYQLMLSSVALCLMAYQIAETLDKGGFNILFTMLAMGTLLQLWIPCYLGSLLRNKGFAVGDACWSCGWHETSLGRMIRTDLVIFLMRAQIPILIKYTGQPVIALETFSAVMSTSYSYFNMLRQSQRQ